MTTDAETQKPEAPKAEPIAACCNCIFFQSFDSAQNGICRFNPPTVLAITSQSNVNGFRGPQVKTGFTSILPSTNYDSFCGKFTPAREVFAETKKAIDAMAPGVQAKNKINLV